MGSRSLWSILSLDIMEGTLGLLKQAGQEQLLQFWEELSDQERNNLLTQITSIDLPAVNSYYK